MTRKNSIGEFNNLLAGFVKIMTDIGNKEMNYFMIMVGNGDNERINKLIAQLEEYDKNADSIYESLRILFKIIRVQCPRYFFLSEEQMLISCSLLKFPSSLMGFIASMFGGVEKILIDEDTSELNVDSIRIIGLETKNGEIIDFEKKEQIDMRVNAEIPLITIVKAIEALKDDYFAKTRSKHIEYIASLNFDFRAIWLYAKQEKILFQILLLMINSIFDHELLAIFTIAEREKKFDIQKALKMLRSMLIDNYSFFKDKPY